MAMSMGKNDDGKRREKAMGKQFAIVKLVILSCLLIGCLNKKGTS